MKEEALVFIRRGDVFCDSNEVAKDFDMKHNKVARTVENILPNLGDFRGTGCTPKIKNITKNYRGTDYTAYEFNRDAFVLVMMRFETKHARRWQGKYIAAFNAMESSLAISLHNAKDELWLSSRSHGKVKRLAETDIIKEFVDYAAAQGSTNSKYYYKHLTNVTYKALGLMANSQPKLRTMMTKLELHELSLLESRVLVLLGKYMALGRNYKDIYASIKEDMEITADTRVISLPEVDVPDTVDPLQ